MVELGTATKDFTVDATAGHLDIDVLSNRRYNLQFLEETSWAGLSVLSLQGDSSFGIDYDDNPGFPRMTRVLLETDNKLHRDTVILRQRGELTPELNPCRRIRWSWREAAPAAAAFGSTPTSISTSSNAASSIRRRRKSGSRAFPIPTVCCKLPMTGIPMTSIPVQPRW